MFYTTRAVRQVSVYFIILLQVSIAYLLYLFLRSDRTVQPYIMYRSPIINVHIRE